MNGFFDVKDLDTWTRGEVESAGATEKRWFRSPDEEGGRWLFKPHTVKELRLSKLRQALGDEPDLLHRGEHWAEKISFEVAKRLNVPSAVTQLARTRHHKTGELLTGSISLDVTPLYWEFAPGAAILGASNPDFDSESCTGHTLPAVRQCLENVKGPPETLFENWQTYDVWAGYLLLDALIANTDRHAYNWAILQRPSDGAEFLAPSFDHGSSLCSTAGEDFRRDRASRAAVAEWCAKRSTTKFNGGSKISLLDLASRGLALSSPSARSYWVQRLNSLDWNHIETIVDSVPSLSEPTSIFIKYTLEENLRRLRHALG